MSWILQCTLITCVEVFLILKHSRPSFWLKKRIGNRLNAYYFTTPTLIVLRWDYSCSHLGKTPYMYWTRLLMWMHSRWAFRKARCLGKWIQLSSSFFFLFLLLPLAVPVRGTTVDRHMHHWVGFFLDVTIPMYYNALIPKSLGNKSMLLNYWIYNYGQFVFMTYFLLYSASATFWPPVTTSVI